MTVITRCRAVPKVLLRLKLYTAPLTPITIIPNAAIKVLFDFGGMIIRFIPAAGS